MFLPPMPRNHSYRAGSPARLTRSAASFVGITAIPDVTASEVDRSMNVARTILRHFSRSRACSMEPLAAYDGSRLSDQRSRV